MQCLSDAYLSSMVPGSTSTSIETAIASISLSSRLSLNSDSTSSFCAYPSASRNFISLSSTASVSSSKTGRITGSLSNESSLPFSSTLTYPLSSSKNTCSNLYLCLTSGYLTWSTSLINISYGLTYTAKSPYRA